MDRPPDPHRRPRVKSGALRVTAVGAPCRLFFSLLLALLLLAGLAGCGVLPMPGTAQPPPSGALVVSFIDVGQGDGVLVQSGGENYLLDAGKAQAGPKVVDFLRSRGVESLNGIVVSNPDADHIGGFLDVLDAFEVSNVYLSGDPKGTSTYNSFLLGLRGSPWWIVAGWALHPPIWDGLLHFFGPGRPFAPINYMLGCFSFDLVVAVYTVFADGLLASRERYASS